MTALNIGSPMPLLRAPASLDHPDGLFDLKKDGFRALASIEGHRGGRLPLAGWGMAKVGAAAVLGCVTLGLCYALFFIARTLEPGAAIYHFAAMAGGVVAGPYVGGVLIQRSLRGRLVGKSLAVDGALGTITLYSAAILLLNGLGTTGATRCAIPRLYAVAAWWSLAFLGPVLGVLLKPLTRSALFSRMLSLAGFMFVTVLNGSVRDWSLTSMAPWAVILTYMLVAVRVEKRRWELDGFETDIGPVHIAVAVGTFAGPAALLLWTGGVCELPPYWGAS